MFRGLSGSRPGQPGRRALKRGRWISRLRGLQGAACRMPDSIRRIPGRARPAPPRCGTGNDPASPIHNPQRHCPRAALRTDLSHTPAEIFARARLRLANACRDARAGYNSGNPPSSSSAPEPRIHSVNSPSLHSLKHHGMDPRLKGEDDEWQAHPGRKCFASYLPCSRGGVPRPGSGRRGAARSNSGSGSGSSNRHC